MAYRPKPIDTSGVNLPQALAELTEPLAQNSHDNWARQRIAEGWTHGRERDDPGKRHPDLLPYADLPEAEKEYDRKMVMETLKGIVKLGYRIEPSDDDPVPDAAREVLPGAVQI